MNKIQNHKLTDFSIDGYRAISFRENGRIKRRVLQKWYEVDMFVYDHVDYIYNVKGLPRYFILSEKMKTKLQKKANKISIRLVDKELNIMGEECPELLI